MATSLTFTITVIEADKKPVFVDAIENQSYTQNTAIATLTLPTATGGDGVLTYALSPSPPDGLTFDARWAHDYGYAEQWSRQ